MDPKAALIEMLSAMDTKDYESAREFAEALLGWLGRGGAEPEMTRHEQQCLLQVACEAILDASAE